LDWGFANPTAFLICQETPDDYVRWLSEKLWYSVELNERCLAIAMDAKALRLRTIYADAAGADENRTLAKHLKNVGASTRIVPVPFGDFKTAGISARRWYLERGREVIGPACAQFAADSKKYRYQEGKDGMKEDVVKADDHTVDAATAFYATRFPSSSGRDERGKREAR
jgi:hypothetical protein